MPARAAPPPSPRLSASWSRSTRSVLPIWSVAARSSPCTSCASSPTACGAWTQNTEHRGEPGAGSAGSDRARRDRITFLPLRMTVLEIVLPGAVDSPHQPQRLIDDIERAFLAAPSERAVVIRCRRHVTHDQSRTALSRGVGKRAVDEPHVVQRNLTGLELHVHGFGFIELILVELEIEDQILAFGLMV